MLDSNQVHQLRVLRVLFTCTAYSIIPTNSTRCHIHGFLTFWVSIVLCNSLLVFPLVRFWLCSKYPL